MHTSLKLTITAVGEPNSVFLTPCKPITLYESIVDVAGNDKAETWGHEEPLDAADALADLADESGIVLLEGHHNDEPAPLRRSA